MNSLKIWDIQESKHLAHVFLHPSAGKSKFEIYEFLGDKVLGIIVTEWIIQQSKSTSEGDISVLHAQWVNKQTLANMGKLMSLNKIIKIRGCIKEETILSDGFEALIGAVYLEQGLDFVKILWKRLSEKVNSVDITSKTKLQEWAHKQYLSPIYTTTQTGGTDHQPIFSCTVKVGNLSSYSTGSSKKNAETNAAIEFIKSLSKINKKII